MGNTGLPLNTSLDQQTVDRVMAFRQDGERISFPGMVRAISRLRSLGSDPDAYPMGFAHWQKFCWNTPDMPAGFMMEMMIDAPATWRSRAAESHCIIIWARPCVRSHRWGAPTRRPFPTQLLKWAPERCQVRCRPCPRIHQTKPRKPLGHSSSNSTSLSFVCLLGTTQ